MKNVLGLLNLHEKKTLIRELANDRPVEMIPFAGRYRLLDFSLSSMVNSGIRNVGILLPEKSRSVLDHVRSGKDWDLARHHGGLVYLPPAKNDSRRRDGDLKDMYYNLDFVEHTLTDYVLIAEANFIYNMDYHMIMESHQASRADISLVFSRAAGEGENGVVLESDDDGVVTDIAECQKVYRDQKLYLGICFMKRSLFADLVRNTFDRGGTDFLLDGVIRKIKQYKINAVEHTGYAREINSIASYYEASMNLFDMSLFKALFHRKHLIATKTKDKSPVHYHESAVVKNSLIANGCEIEGEVENSIIFRGVKVARGVKIRNSIIMQSSLLEENALVEYVICDKNVVISKDKWLRGAPNYPLIVGKNIVI